MPELKRFLRIQSQKKWRIITSWSWLTCPILLSFALGSCGDNGLDFAFPSAEDPDPPPVTITIPVDAASGERLAFSPSPLEITTDTRVTWVNQDNEEHTVTSTAGTFDSGSLAPGASFTFTFEDEGTYTYYCRVHPDSTGVVTVRDNVNLPTPSPSPVATPIPVVTATVSSSP